MKKIILLISLIVSLVFSALAYGTVGNMPVSDGYMCADPTTGGAPYFQSGEYYPYLTFDYYAWVYQDGYLKEYRFRWDNYTLICKYQTQAGHLAWVEAH